MSPAAAGDALSTLGGPTLSLRRVKPAYEQIADQLRELVLVGRLSPGMRLPTELELALQLGVSRPTVREALRHLSAEGLIRTARGAGGGSYVAQPSLDRMASFMSTNISLLERSTELSLAEFLEARELLEIPAARFAAERRTEAELERLRATLPDAPHNLTTGEQFVHNRDFHSTIVDTCANSLLSLAAAPIFIVLQTRLARRRLDDAFHTAINLHHREIAAAIEAADGAAADEAMAEHLAWLRPAYERAWRDGPIV